MKHTNAMVAIAIAAALAMAGCSSPAPSGGAPRPVANTAAATAPDSAMTGPQPVGTVQTLSSGGVTITAQVASYRVVTLEAGNPEKAPAGTRVGLVSAKVCVTADSINGGVPMSWIPWDMLTAQGQTVPQMRAYEGADWPSALFSDNAMDIVPVGQCESGLIPFDLTSLSSPAAQVEYYGAASLEIWSVS